MNNLAPELVDTICEDLSIHNLKQLRLTCKHLAEHLAPHVLRTVRFNVIAGTIERDIPRFRSLVNAEVAAVKGTIHLQLGALAPEHDTTFRSTWKYVDGKSVCDEPPPPTTEQVAANRELQRILGDAIGALKSVQCVTWNPSSKDPPYVLPTIVKTISAYPNLSVLDLNLFNASTPIDISHLRNLQALRITKINKNHLEDAYDSIAHAIANSPGLTLLSINNDVGYKQPPSPTQSLHQLFKYYPADSPSLKLHTLILSQTMMRVDHVTLPHLRHLKHFDFTGTLNPSKIRKEMNRYSWDDSDTYTAFSAEQEARLVDLGQADAEVWDSLRAENIQLESIRHDHYSPSFLRYLSTQTGLKVLQFSPYGFDNGASSDTAAATFFHDSPNSPWSNISQTIEILSIAPNFEGSWCFGGGCFDEEKLSMAKHLKNVNISVISDQLAGDITSKDFRTTERVYNRETGQYDIIPLADGRVVDARALLATELPDYDCVKRLIDVCVTSIHPETLGISYANLERNRGARCGNPAMTHFTRCSTQSAISLRRYRTPPSIPRDAEHTLPILESSRAGIRDLWTVSMEQMLPTVFGIRAQRARWMTKHDRRSPGTGADVGSVSLVKRLVSGYQGCPSGRYPVWDNEKERFGYSRWADEDGEETGDLDDEDLFTAASW